MMKESVSVADDFISVRRWSYDVVHEPDRTAVKQHQKEEKLRSSAGTGKTDLPVPEPTPERGAVDIFIVINLETTGRIKILIMLVQ